MFTAQLAAFLATHHHTIWASHITTVSALRFAKELVWAIRHGFVYMP